MLQIRKTIAIASLFALGALAAMTPEPSFPGQDDLRVAFFPLLLPIGLTIAGIIGSRPWGRWLALAGAIALLPWALAFVGTRGVGIPRVRSWIVLSASVLLLLTMTGRTAYAGFEGRDPRERWAGRRLALVRWTLICNAAAVLNLWMFAAAYTPTAVWHTLIPGLSAIGLIVGVGLLAAQKTAGLLILAVSCLAFPPAALYFLAHQSVGLAERALFVFLFLPGWLTALASLFSFAGPLWRFGKG